MGKIGCFIDPSHRQRILISAFSRALKDPFPPARMAGVLALCATQQYYSLSEISTKILPFLCVTTIDPEKQVYFITKILILGSRSSFQNNQRIFRKIRKS